ncbi:Uncharacterized membrane protein YccC [Pustulibacterium marinum]|uniref:Uncharacterized membrane protein YccC n=1 Tax=Pustulibacterium marinum TaxID=1224947 RepID=A0A1I7FWF4_9FLAO|nr:FUSC family membrane protein [Pustulibacterium marinum]SFU40480.1 Uncharacterized membrane protein YccC [Pustulibacterium marinum]
MTQQLLLFLKTYDFRKGILFAVLGFGVFLGGSFLFPGTPFPIAMGMGILLSAISDVPGTKKHNLIGIATGILFAIVSFSLVHLTKYNTWLLLTTISVLVFFLSYISIFGLRASMVSFSGILAVALGFVNVGPDADFYKSAIFIIVGSGVYILVNSIINLIKPKQIAEQLLVECMQLTADYLKIRGQIALTKNRKPLLDKLLGLQIAINAKHENIREIVLRENANAIGSGYARRQLLIFVELVDILELAIANPINYEDFDEKFKEYPRVLLPFTNLLNTSSQLIKELSFKISHHSITAQGNELRKILDDINAAIEDYKQHVNIQNRRENVLILRNLADYEERQIQKIETIERIIADDYTFDEAKEALEPQRFITSQDYSLRRLRDNFNFSSIIFKHALRHTLAVITGFLIGTYFEISNTYWILITIFVIMRPNYGVTKKRTSERVIGTVIGALVAFAIIYITDNHYIYGIITFFAMIFAFTYIQRNYLKAATAITINIIFVFAILTSDPFNIISSRIIDTIIGAGLSMIFNYFFWPVWESKTLANFLQNSLKANENYIDEVAKIYIEKNRIITEYKLSRKMAFIQMGNLHAAFQRMTQEPKSKQNKMPELYEVVVIQHTFLSAAAALGTYIQSHETTEASEYFKTYINGIKARISNCLALLSKEDTTKFDFSAVEKAHKYLGNIYKELDQEREEELAAGQIAISKKLQSNLKEIRLVYDQLGYLYNLSQDLENNMRKFVS